MNTKMLTLGLFSAAVLATGCGTKIQADVEIGDANGDALIDAFFSAAVRENLPLLQSEDANGDGNLDINEDLDNDFNLDVDEDLNDNGVLDANEVDLDGDGVADPADEDVDGDGELDFFDEDTNGNGQIDVVEVDLNGDGVIDEADNGTLSIFILFASGGTVDCNDFAENFPDGEGLVINDTILLTLGTQVSVGPDIPNLFAAGNTVTAQDEDPTNFVQMLTIFGQNEEGVAVAGSSGVDEEATSVLTIDKLGGKLSASLEATLIDDAGAAFPFSAQFQNVANCKALSDDLQEQLDTGGNFL